MSSGSTKEHSRNYPNKPADAPFFPDNERDLTNAFAQIERDLRERYLIAYSSTNKMRDGSYRKVSIEIVNPTVRKENLKLNYRPGYFAKTAVPEASPTTKKP